MTSDLNILLGLVIAVVGGVTLGYTLYHFARAQWAKGHRTAWPIRTYLWGTLLTAPLGLAALLLPFEMLHAATLILFVLLHGVAAPFLFVAWVVLMVEHHTNKKKASRS
ncbi:MAG: hypothetical protein AAFP97_04080 [Pseudomonadota bacterium]